MSTHTIHHGFSFNQLLGAVHGPRGAPARSVSTTQPPVLDRTDWLTRLANWAERQPVHHRLGSYLLHRR